MIEIFEGFTSISAGADPIPPPEGARAPTGARVSLEFCRDEALPPGATVRAQYEFAGDGCQRVAVGVPTATRTDSGQGRKAVFHYRISHWIAPHALMPTATRNVRYRTEGEKITSNNEPGRA